MKNDEALVPQELLVEHFAAIQRTFICLVQCTISTPADYLMRVAPASATLMIPKLITFLLMLTSLALNCIMHHSSMCAAVSALIENQKIPKELVDLPEMIFTLESDAEIYIKRL